MKNAEIWYIVYANEREQQLNDTNKRHVFTESKTLRFFYFSWHLMIIKKLWSVVLKFTYNFSDLLFCNVYKLCQFLKKKSGFFLDFNKLVMAFLYSCRPAVSSSTRSLIGVFGSSLSNSFSSWKKNGIFNHTFNKTCNINHSAVKEWVIHCLC